MSRADAVVVRCCLVVVLAGCAASAVDRGTSTGSPADLAERYEIATAPLAVVATSSAALVMASELDHDAARNTWSARAPQTLHAAQYLCDGESFAAQPVVAFCSATLIAGDILVSAGHCFVDTPCSSVVVVFDLAYEHAASDAMTAVTDVPAANVYTCSEILSTRYDVGADFTVFRVDRPVAGRAPVAVNWRAPVSAGEPAFVIGHPSGIPQKLATGSVLDGTSDLDFIVHDADVFAGSAGGGLFDAAGTLIGIQAQTGAKRYVPGPTGGCNVVAVCGDDSTCAAQSRAYDPRALATQLAPEVMARLGGR